MIWLAFALWLFMGAAGLAAHKALDKVAMQHLGVTPDKLEFDITVALFYFLAFLLGPVMLAGAYGRHRAWKRAELAYRTAAEAAAQRADEE